MKHSQDSIMLFIVGLIQKMKTSMTSKENIELKHDNVLLINTKIDTQYQLVTQLHNEILQVLSLLYDKEEVKIPDVYLLVGTSYANTMHSFILVEGLYCSVDYLLSMVENYNKVLDFYEHLQSVTEGINIHSGDANVRLKNQLYVFITKTLTPIQTVKEYLECLKRKRSSKV